MEKDMKREARDALGRSKIARLATVSAEGFPNLTPLWFVYDGARLYMNTREASVAVRNLRSNEHVVVLVESARGGIVRIRGTALFTKRGSIRRRATVRATLKYQVSPGGLLNMASSIAELPLRARYYLERIGESGVIVIRPHIVDVLRRPSSDIAPPLVSETGP